LAPAADLAGEQVHAAMSGLRPADREALQLILWDELSYAEAAAVLGCSPNAFELRYRRARNAVRDAIVAMSPAAGFGTERPMRVERERRTEPS
jgi:RNA polymerase sigma-70 factor (ECF subfamily)